MNIYEKIFARLEELHMSQIELSRRTGIATSTISDWRKKKINPQVDKLVSICKALDMSLAELLCDEEVVERTIEPDFMVDGQNIIELLRTFDFETKRRILRYFELIEICREINRENSSQKIKRNVSVIQDINGNNIVMINDIRFKGKRSVDRKDVREYLKEYVGEFYTIAATGASWLCYYRALQEGPASVVVPIDKLSMLVTIAFSWIVFHEKLTKKAAAGVLLITAGTVLLAII